MRSKRIVIGPRKSRYCQTNLTWASLLVEWKLTAKAKLNSEIQRENAGKIETVFVIRAALWAEKLERCLEYCRSWKNTLGKYAVAVNTGGHSIRVLNEGALATVEIFVFCGRWFSNQFDVVSETHFSCNQEPWAMVSDTLLVAVPWSKLEHSYRKARLCVYFNWILRSDVLCFIPDRQSVWQHLFWDWEKFIFK